MIPAGIPTVMMVSRHGSGGPNKDSIPVKEDLSGPTQGYLKNETIIRIVDPNYPGYGKYHRMWNGTFWVSFDMGTSDFVKGQESWCELTGHLEPIDTPPQTDGKVMVWYQEAPGEWRVRLEPK